MEKTFSHDGQTFTEAQILELQKKLENLSKIVKKAEKEGFVEKTKKAPKEKAEETAEVIALKDALKTVIELHKGTIDGLFAETVTEEKPLGQIGVNLTIGVFGKYSIQLLNDETRKAKTPKKEKAPKAETTETETK